jgi:Flp pilus assembly protein TadG
MKGKNESGQSLVEMALVFPLLLLLFLGAVVLGQVIYGAVNVSNAAKSAAQYAAQNAVTADTTSDTSAMLAAAQSEVAIPGLVGALDMPQPIAMPDGSSLPTGTVCTSYTPSSPANASTSYSCSYCTCSNPDAAQPPFRCSTAVVSGVSPTCTGTSHLEQDIIITTHVVVRPALVFPGIIPGTVNLYGHAVVKRLQ